MSEMIEKVAKAIAGAIYVAPFENLASTMADPALFIPIARAVLQAMREPDDAMVEAMRLTMQYTELPRKIDERDLIDIFRAALDAALSPPRGEP